MKRKTLCQNENTVFRWYDRRTRSTVIQTLDRNGNQVGDADYSGDKRSADYAQASIIKANGGAWTLPPFRRDPTGLVGQRLRP